MKAIPDELYESTKAAVLAARLAEEIGQMNIQRCFELGLTYKDLIELRKRINRELDGERL